MWWNALWVCSEATSSQRQIKLGSIHLSIQIIVCLDLTGNVLVLWLFSSFASGHPWLYIERFEKWQENPAGSGLFQEVSIHRTRGLTEGFDECETDVTPIPWPSQSPDLNPTELWTSAPECYTVFSTSIIKTPNERMYFLDWSSSLY